MRIYKELNDKVMDEIISVLDNDWLIIFPTDTVYCIACNSFSDIDIQKLFSVKKEV